MKSFIGMTIFVRIYLPDAARRTAPLKELENSPDTYEWTSEHQEAWESLMQSLETRVILWNYRLDTQKELFADGCKLGAGATLCAIDTDSGIPRRRVCGFYSRMWNSTERHRPPAEFEAMAQVFALTKLEPVILFSPMATRMMVYTDHLSLLALPTVSKLRNERLRKYAETIQRHNLHHVYIPGPQMERSGADAMGRMVTHNNERRVDIDQDPYLYSTLFDRLLPHMRPGGNLVFEEDIIQPVVRTEKPAAYPVAASVPLPSSPPVAAAAKRDQVSALVEPAKEGGCS